MNKKILMLCCGAALALGAFSANAKDSPRHSPMHQQQRPSFEQMDEQLAKQLDLTQEQQDKAKQINKNGRDQMETLMKQMKELRQKMDEVRGKNMLEFEAILTPAQKVRWEDLKMEGRQFRGRYGRHDRFDHDGKFDKFHKKWREDKFDRKGNCGCNRCPGMMGNGNMMPPEAPDMDDNMNNAAE